MPPSSVNAFASPRTADEAVSAQAAAAPASVSTPEAAAHAISEAAPPDDPLPAPIVIENSECGTWVSLNGSGGSGQSAVPRIEKTATGFRIIVHIPGIATYPREKDGQAFSVLDIPAWSRRQDIGRPAVPFKNIMLEIPHGAEPVVRLVSASEVRLGNINVWPAQPLPLDIMPEPPPGPWQEDPSVYGSEDLYPTGRIVRVSVAKLRNRRILSIELAPVQVSAANREIVVADYMEVEVVLEGPPSDSGADTGSDEVLPEGLRDGTLPRYMILVDDPWTTNATLAEFIEWKKRKGYSVAVVMTSAINSNGAPTHSQIRDHLRALPAAEYPEYLLIIGDQTAEGGVEGFYFSTSGGGWSDLYLSCRDAADFLPDLYCGRLPATSHAHLTTMLNKLLTADRTPSRDDYYRSVCMAGQIQGSVDGSGRADRLFCETLDSLASYFEREGSGYACERAIVNPGSVTSDCYWNAESILWNPDDRIGSRVWRHFLSTPAARGRILGAVNRGVALLQHRDHGFGDGSGWANPYFATADVKGLTNGPRLGAVFSVNCASGAYQHDRFLRAWLQNPAGGAYAVLAPVDASYSWQNDWLTHGFYAAFLPDYASAHNRSTDPDWPKDLPEPGGAYGAPGSAQRLGPILSFGKMYCAEQGVPDETIFRLYHLFGDPESFLLLQAPRPQSVSHVEAIAVGPATVTVSTGEEGAQVALYSEELGIHAAALTKADGTASFDITPAATGTVSVTVTKCGRYPSESSLAVTAALPVDTWADKDTDGDSMQDGWEVRHNLDPTDDTDASADPDGDGFSNRQEWVADTNPRDKNSFFQIMAARHMDSSTVVFACTNSRVYSLQFATNLVNGEWWMVNGATNVTGVGGFMSLTDTVDSVQRSYRVGVSIP